MIWTGAKLKELREKLNVTARELGSRIGYVRAKSVFEAESKEDNEVRKPIAILLSYIDNYGIDYVVMSSHDVNCIIQMLTRVRNLANRVNDKSLFELAEMSMDKVEYNLNGKYSEKY